MGDPSLERVAVARIIKERGIKGEVKALPLSDNARYISPQTDIVLCFPSGQRVSYTLQSVRVDRQSLIVALAGITSPEAAAQLREAVIEVMPDDLPGLPEGSYYHNQIIGLRVVTTEGVDIGRITDIIETGSNDVYVVHGLEMEHLIPAIRDVVLKIDLPAGTITIYPMKGLLE